MAWESPRIERADVERLLRDFEARLARMMGVAERAGTPLHLNTCETWWWNSGTSATAATLSAPHIQAGSASRAGRKIM